MEKEIVPELRKLYLGNNGDVYKARSFSDFMRVVGKRKTFKHLGYTVGNFWANGKESVIYY